MQLSKEELELLEEAMEHRAYGLQEILKRLEHCDSRASERYRRKLDKVKALESKLETLSENLRKPWFPVSVRVQRAVIR